MTEYPVFEIKGVKLQWVTYTYDGIPYLKIVSDSNSHGT